MYLEMTLGVLSCPQVSIGVLRCPEVSLEVSLKEKTVKIDTNVLGMPSDTISNGNIIFRIQTLSF